MLTTPPAAVHPTLVVDRGGRRLHVDPATLAAALHHLRPQLLNVEERAAQAAAGARLRSADLLGDGALVPWAARLLGPVALPQARLDVETFEGGKARGFGLWQGDARGTLVERGADGVLTLSTIPGLHTEGTVADLVGLEDSSERACGEAITIDGRLLGRFLARLAAGDTPRAGALLAGQSVSLQALRALLALADGRARWWRIERTTDPGEAVPAQRFQVIDAGVGGLWCSEPQGSSSSSELLLAPTPLDDVFHRLATLCRSCVGATSAA